LLLLLRVFRFGVLQDGDVGVGVFWARVGLAALLKAVSGSGQVQLQGVNLVSAKVANEERRAVGSDGAPSS
jgi:hypothetical protein